MESIDHAARTSKLPTPALPAIPPSPPHPTIANPSWILSPSCFFARSQRTQPSLPDLPRCRSLAGWPQIARSMAPHPAPTLSDSCERYPFGTLHPAAHHIHQPPAQANDETPPSSLRRSSQSRPCVVPAPIAARHRIVPFKPWTCQRPANCQSIRSVARRIDQEFFEVKIRFAIP